MTNIDNYTDSAIKLLKKLIMTPSFSEEEEGVVKIIETWFTENEIIYERHLNNLWAKNKFFDNDKPTILLNSHHDTVKPNKSFTFDPFEPIIEDGKLYGLGSNDAGGALVSLLHSFKNIYLREKMKYNIIIAATAEEETAGKNGISSILDKIPNIDFAIIGEPTLMDLAVAERGLIVFDAKIKGTPSHAAHQNNDNAIEKVPEFFNWLNSLEFERISEFLGPVKITLTQINAGYQHNVIPSEVNFVIDVRVNELYTNTEINRVFTKECPCEIKARSLNLKSSFIDLDNNLVNAARSLGIKLYGSPTLSDQAQLNFPSVKIGPGDSKRSHSANEFIFIDDITNGIDTYNNLLNKIL